MEINTTGSFDMWIYDNK